MNFYTKFATKYAKRHDDSVDHDVGKRQVDYESIVNRVQGFREDKRQHSLKYHMKHIQS